MAADQREVAAVMRFAGMGEMQAIRHIEQRHVLLRAEWERRRLAAQRCADNYAATFAANHQEKK